ncbi:RNA polymerase sigma-70 factor, ECF subfamily [Pedobacter steynii]|uniref:RNA polymerase sigma-70 factor, ECF subfamily n=1 Tax=Pedobacter steynii TaxID=430522 RepID=A0A1G9T183_9SPHI|nr:RNA polymerase sigma-70 factor [Pedobacter steynii]NQX37267.1 RNA polymerase sigma-70 factor [Pedobacter steynii]SDM41367.1 RNA polymerase sigma-70 factor, ECF subfamily [Pedobacter steynii]
MQLNKQKRQSDEELLKAIQNEDRSAFECLYHKYWQKLYLSAYHILKDIHAAEDIIQEIFAQLWLKRDQVAIDNLAAYLHTAVRFQVFKAIRDGKARIDLSSQAEEFFDKNSIEDILHEKELDKRLEESIATLPEKCREIFILSRKEHLSVKEIAARLQISPKTVENQITIALRKLRTQMGDLLFWAVVLLRVITRH